MPDKTGRRTVLKSAGAVGIGLLAGCSGDGGDGSDGGSNESSDGGDTETPGGTATADSSDGGTGSDASVGIVFAAGGLGDQGFNDLAHEGIQRAESDLGISFDMAQPDDVTQFEQFQRRFAQSSSPDYDLICTIGFTQAQTLKTISQEFPDQQFMIVDGLVEQPNVASYTFREHEGSYLVGVAAGHLTNREFSAGGGSTNPDARRIGFVGGVESFLINKFRAGYAAGAQSVDSEIEVLASYVGSFSDPSSAKESAKGMYANDADLIFPAAGGSGVGIFQAAQEDGRLGFGVDTRKSITQSEYADVILGSMIKRTDRAVFESIDSFVSDEFPSGETVALGLERDGVNFVAGDTIGDQIPDGVTSAIDESRQAIVDGEIDVPSEL